MQVATKSLTTIAEKTEDKEMYDAREKAIRDRLWMINQSHLEGEIKGEIKGEIRLIQTLEGILGLTVSKVEDLQKLDLESLQEMTSKLQDKARKRL
jgi:predicted transposase YdaD